MWHGILLAGLLLSSQVAKTPPSSAIDSAGVALMNSGRLSEAEAQFRKALEINPRDIDALNNLGVVLRRRHRAGEAVDFLRAAAKIRPEDPRIRSNLALALAQAGRLNDAIAELQEAARFAPRDADIHRNLGILLFRAQKRNCTSPLKLIQPTLAPTRNSGVCSQRSAEAKRPRTNIPLRSSCRRRARCILNLASFTGTTAFWTRPQANSKRPCVWRRTARNTTRPWVLCSRSREASQRPKRTSNAPFASIPKRAKRIENWAPFCRGREILREP